jgi:hypothetical protein
MDITRQRRHRLQQQWLMLRRPAPVTLGWADIGIPLVHVTLGTPVIGLGRPTLGVIGSLLAITDIAITAATGGVKLRYATKRARAASTIDGYLTP